LITHYLIERIVLQAGACFMAGVLRLTPSDIGKCRSDRDGNRNRTGYKNL
jgi:hypothetical protein